MSGDIEVNEKFRLEALYSLDILDSQPQKEFDDITSLAAQICNVQTSLISFVDKDRQWFKSNHGLDKKETIREYSFCSYAIRTPQEPFIVPDARKDERFSKNPLTLDGVVIFYAGVPLIDKNGFALGTLCVIDGKPKELSEDELKALNALANQVILLIELNKKNRDLEKIQKELKKKNDSLHEFAKVISHDLKMPLSNIITSTDLLKLILKHELDNESLEYFDYIKTSSFAMSAYINDLLGHYESDSLIHVAHEEFLLNDVLKDIVELLSIKPDFVLEYPKDNPLVNSNKLALKQIFFNLIGNSIKYNDKEEIKVVVKFNEDDLFYYFQVTDNGMGIPDHKINDIFKLFTTADQLDRSGNKGNGIGLSTVLKIVTSLDGTITVNSKIAEYTSFHFSIKKSF